MAHRAWDGGPVIESMTSIGDERERVSGHRAYARSAAARFHGYAKVAFAVFALMDEKLVAIDFDGVDRGLEAGPRGGVDVAETERLAVLLVGRADRSTPTAVIEAIDLAGQTVDRQQVDAGDVCRLDKYRTDRGDIGQVAVYDRAGCNIADA